MTSTGPDPTSFSPSGNARDDDDPGDGMHSLADAAARMLDGYARVMMKIAESECGRTETDGQTETAQDLPAALTEAWMIASGSAMRYGQGLTEVFARHQSALMQAAMAHLSPEGLTPQQRRAEAEEVDQFLREVGETAMSEARCLERELASLGKAVAHGATKPRSGDTCQPAEVTES